jgi:dCTP deaminase
VLGVNTFYILSTKEYVRVPPKFACEMAPMDERSGELRSHYAGFIDPGWGIGRDGSSKGRPLTLEVRSFDNGLIIQDGQPISKIRYERVIERPEVLYDDDTLSNYTRQYGPGLSKHFKKWK